MGFFSKLKAAVGIGNPKIEFSLENTQVPRGNSFKGTIKLTGSSGEIPVTSFIVELVEEVTQKRWNGNTKKEETFVVDTTIAKIILPKNGQIIKENEILSESFEILVSPNAHITSFPVEHKLKVSADIPGLDSRAKQDVFIV